MQCDDDDKAEKNKEINKEVGLKKKRLSSWCCVVAERLL